jgi:hypothetical protein
MVAAKARSKVVWVVAALLSAVAVAAEAQGRHDDKPHGMNQLEEREMADPKVHAGGPRHDEQGHKAAIRASQQKAAKKAEAPKPAVPAARDTAPPPAK